MKTVNYIKCGCKGKSTRVFQKLCEEVDSENVTVLLHTRGALALSWQSFDSCVQVKNGNINFSCREKS